MGVAACWIVCAMQCRDDPWLTGFIDGEGCFTRYSTRSAGVREYRPKFSLGLRWDDEPLLDRLKQEMGGSVNDARCVMRGGRQPGVAWVVSSRRDLTALVAYLERFPLRSRKAEQYKAWLATWSDYIAGGPAIRCER